VSIWPRWINSWSLWKIKLWQMRNGSNTKPTMSSPSTHQSRQAFGIAWTVYSRPSLDFYCFVIVFVASIKASLSQIQTTLEALEFKEWTEKIFAEKLLALEKCQVLDHLENLQEEWLLRFKFPFPFGNKSTYVTRTFYAPNANSFHMLLLPIPGKSKSTLGTFRPLQLFFVC
jgi:hypothetical protein